MAESATLLGPCVPAPVALEYAMAAADIFGRCLPKSDPATLPSLRLAADCDPAYFAKLLVRSIRVNEAN